MNYQTPRLQVLGRVEELTRATFADNAQDSIFLDGVLAGHAVGSSYDACVSLNPKVPSGTCNIPDP